MAGPIIAMFAMFYSVDWFGITEDGQEYLGLFAWFLLGLAVAIVSGVLVRWAFNRMAKIDPPGY